MSSVYINEIKPCKQCGSTSNSFAPNRRVCTKCRSKRNNELLNERNFYKEYYEKNKVMLRIKANLNYLKRKNHIESLEDFTPYENCDTDNI
jgi:hypothetical protein